MGIREERSPEEAPTQQADEEMHSEADSILTPEPAAGSPPQDRWPKASFLSLAVALTVSVMLSIALGYQWLAGGSAYSRPPGSARELLESRAFQEAAAEQMLEMGKMGQSTAPHMRRNPVDKGDIRDAVRAGVHRYIEKVQQKAPPGSRGLSDIPVTEEKGDAVLRLLNHLSDPRVHALGLRVAGVVRAHANESKEAIRHRVGQQLTLSSEELRQFRDDIIPETLRPQEGIQSTSKQWDLVLSPQRLRLLTSFQGWDVDFTVAEPQLVSSNHTAASRRLAEPAGATGQVFTWIGAVFDMVELMDKILLRSFGIEVPAWMEGITTFYLAGDDIISCALQDLKGVPDVVFCLILNSIMAIISIIDFFL